MVLKRIILKFILLFFVTPHIYASNGSSGIGNAETLIVPNVVTVTPPDWVKRVNNSILDSRTGEKVLEVNKIRQSNVNQLISSGSLVKAKLGFVDGFEFLPKRESNDEVFWVICSKGVSSCNKISVKAQSNSKAPAVMGSLKKNKPLSK